MSNREFGDHQLIGDNNDAFFRKSTKEKAYEIGYSHACPEPDRVITIFESAWALRRYAECNYWTGEIHQRAKKINPDLYEQLSQSISRRPGEKPNKYEIQNVPNNHIDTLSPLSTTWGYALPRILIEEIGRGEDRSADRMIKALDDLEEVLAISKNPIELTVALAKQVVQSGVSPEVVLGHILAIELENEGLVSFLEDTTQELRKNAPEIAKVFADMPDRIREKHGISSKVRY